VYGHLADDLNTFETRDMEFTAAFALAFHVDGLGTYGDKAISVANYLAGVPIPSNRTISRQQLLAMAFAYDWMYYRFSTAQRTYIRQTAPYSIAKRINAFRSIPSNEYMWGYASEDILCSIAALIAILGDGNAEENATWLSWFETLLDAFENATNVSFMAPWKYFGDADGGSYKGAGPHSYINRHEEYMYRCFPGLRSGVQIDYWTRYPFWSKLTDWILWHYRGDRGFGHTQNDGMRQSMWTIATNAHMVQVSQWAAGTTLGRRARWLAKEIEAVNYHRIWGPYYIVDVFFRDNESYPSVDRPTIDGTGNATTGTKQMKIFSPAKKICVRTGFESTATSMTLSGQRPSGGHSHRDAGHFDLCHNATPLIVEHGTYDSGAYTYTYKIPGDPLWTGHVWSYYKREIAHSLVRIHDSEELAENRVESFQAYFGLDSFFGVKDGSNRQYSNTGGQLWPKDIASNIVEPTDLAHWLASSWWSYETIAHSEEQDSHCYVVLELTKAYYSNKCSRYKRHIVWIKPYQFVADYPYPIVVIWDDLTTHVDAVKGAKTCVYQIQTIVRPVGNANAFALPGSNATLYHKTLSPAALNWRTVAEWVDEDGVIYPATRIYPYDDSQPGQVFRVELWPTVGAASTQLLSVLFPVDKDIPETDLPTLELYNDASYFGIEFTHQGDGWELLLAKGDTHSSIWRTTAPPPPPPTVPSPPTGLTATGADGSVTLDWDDNAESDLAGYKIYRRAEIGVGVWGEWGFLTTRQVSSYVDNSVSNGTTYQYYVTAYNTSDMESLPSEYSNEVTPQSPPPPPPPPPPLPGAFNNERMTAFQHMTNTHIPIPSRDSIINEGDLAHCLWLWSGFDYGPPDEDFDGDELVCPGEPESGTCMVKDATGTSGVTIETLPVTTLDGEVIEGLDE